MNEYRKFNLAKIENTALTSGFWGHRTENYMEIIESQLEALLNEKNSARLLNFGIQAGEVEGEFFGSDWSDGDCYKFLEACCHIYQTTKDEKVKAVVDKYIPWILKSQQDDGYLNTQRTINKLDRWQRPNHHELYNCGHLFTFAVSHYGATGDDRMLECAKRLAAYLYEVFSGYPKELGHFGFNPSQIMGLSDLYQVTKDKKHIELAEIFVNMRGSVEGGTDQNQDRVPLREETTATGHAVTSTYLYAGATDVYAETGEKALINALETIYTDLTTKRIYITGGVCPDFVGYSERGDETHESHSAEYFLPNKVAYNESCANIGAAMWCMRMLAVLGDTKYGDMAEQILHNSGISGSNLNLTRYFYSNPLAYRVDEPISNKMPIQYTHRADRRWHTFTCWCCPPQLFRTMAGIGRWIYGENDSEVYVNLFASCDYKDDTTAISMKTNYPWDGNVEIKVDAIANKKLKIRIPSWCKKPTINGATVKAGEYAVLDVKTGDTIKVELPMEVVILQANANVEADRGMVCFKRGPVVFGLSTLFCTNFYRTTTPKSQGAT
ncbi:MAG: glycoside hydrolase family 127 protein [Bacillota bacterium]